MANYIESNVVARPHRQSKRRGKQPDKLCVRLFLLDPQDDATSVKDTYSRKEAERLRENGYGPPPTGKACLF